MPDNDFTYADHQTGEFDPTPGEFEFDDHSAAVDAAWNEFLTQDLSFAGRDW